MADSMENSIRCNHTHMQIHTPVQNWQAESQPELEEISGMEGRTEIKGA